MTSETYDRLIPDTDTSKPPTARNLGWYSQYTPEQRYIAYITTYTTLAEYAQTGQMDEFADYAAWVLGHAAADGEAALAGIAMINEDDGPGQAEMKAWHNTVYGEGYLMEGQDHPYADLMLPKINPNDPEGTVERFIEADLGQYGSPATMRQQPYDNQTEKAMLWTIGLFEKAGNLGSQVIEALGGPEADIIDPEEKFEREGTAEFSDMLGRIGENVYGPEEGTAAYLRNIQDSATQGLSNVAVASMMGGQSAQFVAGPVAAGSPAAGGLWLGGTKLAATRWAMRNGMSAAWNRNIMGVSGQSLGSSIASGMKSVAPEGIRLAATRVMSQVAGGLAKSRSTSAPWIVQQTVGKRPLRTLAGGVAAGTLGVEAARTARMGIGDIDIGEMVDTLPEGQVADYLQRSFDDRQGITSMEDAGIPDMRGE